MERNEMIKVLMEKANVNKEEAEQVLENNGWDLLKAIEELEKNGKLKDDGKNKIVEAAVSEERQDGKNSGDSKKEKHGGFGELVGRMFRFIGKIIKKGSENYFELNKENERPIRIPLIVSVLLLLFLTPLTVILLIVGLFCGYKYSLSGKNIKCDGVNDAFEKASETADSFKNDFKKGYEGER